MDNNIMEKFYNSYQFLTNHPIFSFKDAVFNHITFSEFEDCLSIEIVKVNPETKTISDIKEENTLVQVWLEAGPYSEECRTHDIDLDCGGNNFEEAIIKLAELVKDKYGDYQEEEE